MKLSESGATLAHVIRVAASMPRDKFRRPTRSENSCVALESGSVALHRLTGRRPRVVPDERRHATCVAKVADLADEAWKEQGREHHGSDNFGVYEEGWDARWRNAKMRFKSYRLVCMLHGDGIMTEEAKKLTTEESS